MYAPLLEAVGSPTAYPITAQLYFDGEIDAETAEEYSDCCQKITPLGFKWNGYDVILIETKYTFMDYPEQTELFGVDSGIENPFMQDETEETVVNVDSTALIGTWMESETGINETVTFNADGTGKYSCLSGGGTYECGFTYEFLRSDYIDIYYDDGDVGGFQIVIDGNKLTVRNEYVWDLVYIRQ